jgi:hypothetical protein
VAKRISTEISVLQYIHPPKKYYIKDHITMSDVAIYKAQDGYIELQVNLSEETVWLNQKQLSDLFDKNVKTISEHINNIFKEGELTANAVIRNFRITATDGKSYEMKQSTTT